MEITTRTRAELKQYFVKNAIPTEKNFAELIDAALNLREDGIVKPSGNPLSIEATGDDTSQQKVLHLYRDFDDPDPAWVLSLNPRQNPADPATARPGLSIGNAAGNSRLFIDPETGNVGMSTTKPEARLHVDGGALFNGKVGVGTPAPQAGLHIDRGATNDLALLLSSSGPGWGSGLQFRNTPAGGTPKTFGIYAGFGGLYFVDVDASANRMVLQGDGNLGVGTSEPAAKLHVAGAVRANRYTGENALVLNNFTTKNPSSNVYLYSPPDDRDAWVYLDSADANSNWGIYHRQINTPIAGLPANSIGFVGGGASKLQAYVNLGDGSGYFAGTLRAGGYPETTASVNAWRMEIGGNNPSADGTRGGVLYLHDHGRVAHQLRYNFGTLYLEAAGNGYGTSPTPSMWIGGDLTVNGTFVRVRGAGNESAYFGGDGAGNDVEIGSESVTVSNVYAYNRAKGNVINFHCLDCVEHSDMRSKRDIEAVPDALQKLRRLRAVSFRWKGGEAEATEAARSESPKTMGLLAQEVRDVLPGAVVEGKNGKLGVVHRAITALLVESIKEQQTRIDHLQATIDRIQQSLSESAGTIANR